jgi:hypothetical protein
LELVCILVSFLSVAGTYLYVSLREGTFLNILTPAAAFLLPADYLLEAYHLLLYGPSASLYAYVLIYACYAATFAAFALSYAWTKVPSLRLPFAAARGGGRVAPYLVLLAAIALYAPILIEFRDNLTNPREIYEQTRSDYGVFFYLSTTLCYLALILLLFRRRLGKGELGAFTLVCLIFLWLHGSKNQMLLVLFVLTTYWVYVRNRRVSFGKFVLFSGALAAVGVGLFLLTNPLIVLDRGLEGLASYSDYTRNGMLVIDSDISPMYGRLTLEQEIYSRVPRPLFPQKPDNFGALYLAAHFYPYDFLKGQGAPAFSFGPALADFGPLALPILLIENVLAGVLLKMFVTGLRRYNDPGSFTLMLFMAGLTLIPVSVSFVLPEALVLAVAINFLNGMRLRPRSVAQLADGPDSRSAGAHAAG